MAHYRITSAYLPGLAKLAEECSEVSQSAAKIIGGCDALEQLAHLEEEIGDVFAALAFFMQHNDLDRERIAMQRKEKQDRWNIKRDRRMAQNGR